MTGARSVWCCKLLRDLQRRQTWTDKLRGAVVACADCVGGREPDPHRSSRNNTPTAAFTRTFSDQWVCRCHVKSTDVRPHERAPDWHATPHLPHERGVLRCRFVVGGARPRWHCSLRQRSGSIRLTWRWDGRLHVWRTRHEEGVGALEDEDESVFTTTRCSAPWWRNHLSVKMSTLRATPFAKSKNP